MQEPREVRVINSALWAAAGDAVGWISELTDLRGLERRADTSRLSKTVAWKRRLGGLHGVDISLPAGTYSDDTQLRLATCRSIRADGTFDVEAFAKIELPVWSGYALGAGRGSKAAAANLSKRDVNWFSNFYVGKDGLAYHTGGGNGAAMRVQPHVWASPRPWDRKSYWPDTVRNAIVTHGHMLGICGALFHADCLAYAIEKGSVPGPAQWEEFLLELHGLPELVAHDEQLGVFWLGAWEKASKTSIYQAVEDTVRVASGYLGNVRSDQDVGETYTKFLDSMGCRNGMVGAGLNTAIASVYAAWCAEGDPESAVLLAANTLGSDTDTIATMTGAIVGAVSARAPSWSLQDVDYIRFEARRMADISRSLAGSSFTYPDLATWKPPRTQAEVLGTSGGKPAVKGLGYVELINEVRGLSQYAWQWVELPFGQTILCKRFLSRKIVIPESQLPGTRVEFNSKTKNGLEGPNRPEALSPADVKRAPRVETGELFSRTIEPLSRAQESVDMRRDSASNLIYSDQSIDELTEIAIRSQFDERVIGACLKACARGKDGVERAMAFSVILAKAILARSRR